MALSPFFLAPPSLTPCFLPKLMPLKVRKNQYQAMHAKCMTVIQTCDSTDTTRRSANYQPSIWHYDFIQSIKSDYKGEPYTSRAEQLKQKTRKLLEATTETFARLELINKLQRLGLGYLFEKEVKSSLEAYMFNPICGDNLYTTALHFRILRENGFKVTTDVFSRFTNGNINFKSNLCGDVKGMLSLFEASHLGFEGESILDEARAFSSRHLKSMLAGQLEGKLASLVQHSLDLPLHKRMLRLEARWYIDVYEDEEGMNPTLLELAKLDFNMVQAIHQRGLKKMSRWWMGIGFGEKLSFARDRLMESFFWAGGVVSDPQFANVREGLTKVYSLIVTIDDVYDIYGTLDELELFTDAIDKWDLGAMDQLPDYMKICFLALYNTINEMAYDTLKQHDCNIIQHLKKSWADLCKSFLVEAKWYKNGYIPTLEEYLENAWISSSGPIILFFAYFLSGQEITQEALQCLENHPKIICFASMIYRLCNDLASSTAEQERGDAAESVQCYMKQAGVSEEIAREHIRDLITSTWTKLNSECHSSSSQFPQHFINTCVNLARMSQCIYQYGDGLSAPNKDSKNVIIRSLVESVQLQQ